MQSVILGGCLAAICVAAAACAPGGGPEAGSVSEDIVGGRVDAGHAAVVAVGDEGGAFCTGTVVSKRTVLTAGHCFLDPDGSNVTRVYFGTNVLVAQGLGRSIAVVDRRRHPDFTEDPLLSNDLALVQLAEDAPAQPAPLLRETMTDGLPFVGPDFTFVGFGLSNGALQIGSGVKRVVRFPIEAVGPAAIDAAAGAAPTVDAIDATMFYYRVARRNTCNGDSGGPAFVVRGGVERLAGVTSFGDAACVVDGVQSRADAPQIAAFLQPVIDEFEGGDACRSDGACVEACNAGGQVRDPDCAAEHCGRDGLCAESCVRDPDCF
jgi:Trypsin